MNKAAVIFDLDGVIIDSEPLHKRAWKAVFEEKGIILKGEELAESVGTTDRFLLKKIIRENNLEPDQEKWYEKKREKYNVLLKNNLQAFPGAISLIKKLSERHSLALASSAWRKNIKFVLNKLRLTEYFKVVIGREDVGNHKPNPDVYLLAGERLALPFHKCIVIEDSLAGIRAAKKAGMKCIAIANSFPPERLKETDLVVNTLEDKTILQFIKAVAEK
ncbi:HAD family phosphatase [candidate division NPL-UPA2 bacterium]|nr:HAD family phosphatase [candidate division NPL-UPA2 bacterium]